MAKKKKQKDFQKIKLKVGRTLKRAPNETKTEFKTRKIIIKESQLIARDPIKLLLTTSLTTNQAKLSCLTKLNDAIVNIDIKHINGELINGLAKYLIDNDTRVRQETIKCIKQCLEILQNKQSEINTLISMLITYINCALTHINQSISNDGYKLLIFIVDKCNHSSLQQLMTIMMARISNCSDIKINDYEILAKIVQKIKKTDSSVNACKEPVIKWSKDNCYVNINSFLGYKQPPQFNISFQLQSQIDIEEKFLSAVQSVVVNDLKVLFAKDKTEFNFTVKEADKLIPTLNIARLIKSEIIPKINKANKINPISISSLKKLSKKDEKKINSLKTEITYLIENLFK